MRIATDIGGTFTDLVYVDKSGHMTIDKGPTTPPNFENGIIDLLKEHKLDQNDIDYFIHGSTVVINALTERTGVKTGLVTTKGFRDVLEIARGNRPDLFNIRYQKPRPFVKRYFRREVDERIDHQGNIIKSLDKSKIERIVQDFKQDGVEAIGIVFLHSYTNPIHEIKAKQLIQELWPEVSITASHEITMELREYERTSTTVLNAYVKPIATTYLNNLQHKLDNLSTSKKYIMQSNGGTTTFDQAKKTPINMVESGPVAGVYGASILGDYIGEENIIAFDIGGTTAKCSLIENGKMNVSTDYYIEKTDRTAGYPIKVPVVDIVEIGNGGGSIAWVDDSHSLKVGPQSAGAYPGPIAYNQGGDRPTTTDANLLAGRLSPENFDYHVDMDQVEQVIDEQIATPFNVSADDAALGIIRIANSNMLNALKLISIRKGHDPRNFTLVAFGGGGSMHAPTLARELGVKKVVIPFASPVFSAWGMLMTDLRNDFVQTYIKRMDKVDFIAIDKQWARLKANALEQFKRDGVEESILFSHYVDMRYVGQEHTVKVPLPTGSWNEKTVEGIVNEFHKLHEKNYTFRLDGTPTEIVNLHLVALGRIDKIELKEKEIQGSLSDALIEKRNVYFEEDGWMQTNVYDRDNLPTDQRIEGPAIVEEKSATTVILKGQSLYRDVYGNLIIHTGVDHHE